MCNFEENVFQGWERDAVADDTYRFKISVESWKEGAELVAEILRDLEGDLA